MLAVDFGWELVAVVGIHAPILPTSTSYFGGTPGCHTRRTADRRTLIFIKTNKTVSPVYIGNLLIVFILKFNADGSRP
jgi:hypothetical protein